MLRIYNTLTRKIEKFEPKNPPEVKMYTCGPTVYDFSHIGHMRRYVGDDILVRILDYNGFEVKNVVNITDVGHLTSDEDTGEDKMEKGALMYKMSVWNVAKKFEEQFWQSCELLNIKKPSKTMKATDYIKDQIELVQILEEKGITYKTEDGIYFDTSKFPNYNRLSGQNAKDQKAGIRVEMKEKKNLTDFALWKFSPIDNKRQMEWDSPWGKGFPGWHIECSAMAMREFGPTLDIHTGGIDHINIHHTNEIAQSEAATGKEFVRYWVHYAWLLVNGKKMSKSLNNFYTVEDIVKKKFDPLALRYLYLQTHYRQEMNFTFEALEAAQTALNRLKTELATLGEPKEGFLEIEGSFYEAINDDLNVPKALAVVWELLNSKEKPAEKAAAILKFDKILGLDLDKVVPEERKERKIEIPRVVMEMLEERNSLRKQKRFHLADQIRHKIRKYGFDVEDKEDEETKLKPIE